MKRIEEELRLIRQQMEEDFLLHSERISAQKQSVARVERALETVHDSIGQLRHEFGTLRHEFGQFAQTSQSHQDTWSTERQRNLRVLDVIQTGLLTGSLETESRLERVEQRLSRLEDQQSGAA